MSLFDTPKQEIIFELGVDETAKAYLLQTARWTRFMAIMGFIFTGLLLAMAVFLAASSSVRNGFGDVEGSFTITGIIAYFLIAVLYIYPISELYRFSTSVKQALIVNDAPIFTKAMKHQRNMWRFMGIMMIVIIAVYGTIFLFMVARGFM